MDLTDIIIPASSSQKQQQHHHHHHHQIDELSNDFIENHKDKNIENSNQSGIYNAEKCRNYIANQIKVNKIDRFANQIDRAKDIELSIENRLSNLMNMFAIKSAEVIHDFTFRCQLGVQRHKQDRILNYHHHHHHPQMRTKKRANPTSDVKKKLKIETVDRQQLSARLNAYPSISNDILYGPGARLVHSLLAQSAHDPTNKPAQPESSNCPTSSSSSSAGLNEDDYVLADQFEPKSYVTRLENDIKLNMEKSRFIIERLNKLRKLFEELALKHRDRVDKVYAIEEERQAASVIRRSTYNLSISAIKATSTPVHISNVQSSHQ